MTPTKSEARLRRDHSANFTQNKSVSRSKSTRKLEESGVLTIEQTQNLMDEIMKEKQIKNKSCRDKKEPYLTMEEFI